MHILICLFADRLDSFTFLEQVVSLTQIYALNLCATKAQVIRILFLCVLYFPSPEVCHCLMIRSRLSFGEHLPFSPKLTSSGFLMPMRHNALNHHIVCLFKKDDVFSGDIFWKDNVSFKLAMEVSFGERAF